MRPRGIGFLKKVDILASLSDEERAHVRQYLGEMDCKEDDVVFHQGDVGTELYIVGKGTVSIRVQTSDGDDVELAQFGSGDFFGEMSIFEDAPRSATCVMSGGGRLYRLRKEDLFLLMREHPATAIKMMYRMINITTGRLTHTSSFPSDLVQWGEGARRRAITDDLTGLYNRRYLDDVLDQQFAQARVNKQVFSLIMMDLDHFHTVNDKYGQQVGDQVIAAVAPSVSENLGDAGIAARYGGDEFTIILPGLGADEAFETAQRIRLSVESLEIPVADSDIIRVTTSQGIAEYPTHAKSLDELKERSDQALYKAKESGRNCAAIA